MSLFNKVCRLSSLLYTKIGTEKWRLIQISSIANKRICDTDNTEHTMERIVKWIRKPIDILQYSSIQQPPPNNSLAPQPGLPRDTLL
jgi:hypothetical protein